MRLNPGGHDWQLPPPLRSLNCWEEVCHVQLLQTSSTLQEMNEKDNCTSDFFFCHTNKVRSHLRLTQCFSNCGAWPSSGSHWCYRWGTWRNSVILFWENDWELPILHKYKVQSAVASLEIKDRSKLNIERRIKICTYWYMYLCSIHICTHSSAKQVYYSHNNDFIFLHRFALF